MQVLQIAFRRFEVLLAVALIGASLLHWGQMARAMATTSLTTDEFGTVGTFSAKGPVRVVTDYRAPKNHVFFNLLNSLLPDRDSFAPARVRALSILATLLTVLVLVVYAARRGHLLEAGALLALWSTAPEMLQLSMEARGYGFLGLFGVLSAIATLEYVRERNIRWLWALAVSVVLGVYTVPGFLFYAAPLMALLWLTERSRVTFLAGVAAALAILLLYTPLIAQVIAAFHEFHVDKNEADFRTAHGLVRAAKLYLFPSDDWEAWTLLGALAFAPFLPARGTDRREGTALRIVAAACVAHFVALRVLHTPPLRMAAFALLPLSIAGLWALGNWIRHALPPIVRPIAFGVFGLTVLADTLNAIRTFHFTPAEDWLLSARAIDAAFPSGVKVDFRRYAKYLGQTLPDADARTASYEEAAFADGRLVVADAGNKWAGGSRFTPPADLDRVAQWTIPGTIRDVVLTFRLPAQHGLIQAPPPLADGNIDTGVGLQPQGLVLRGENSPGAKALVVLLDRAPSPDELRIDAPALVAGNGIVIPLQNSAAPAETHLSAAPGSNLRAMEAWITR
jgi:hypothetical protein